VVFSKWVKGQDSRCLLALDGELIDMPKSYRHCLNFLQARMVQALLDEKGKTISDADRTLIKELLGNLERYSIKQS
jgi:hypothetical protein